ncbi:hypothetical protein KEM48_004780 [Puccinia striiformis f. sp. tritici PST-130]|nr:hypothetical protein KEM48_004780 [Puccinia striiformis f. sp. tritici PST-130]
MRTYKCNQSELHIHTINPKSSRNPRETDHEAKMRDPNANVCTCDDFNRSSTLLFHSASNAAPLPLLPEWTDHYPQGLIQRPTTPLYEPYQYGNQPSVTPGIFDQTFPSAAIRRFCTLQTPPARGLLPSLATELQPNHFRMRQNTAQSILLTLDARFATPYHLYQSLVLQAVRRYPHQRAPTSAPQANRTFAQSTPKRQEIQEKSSQGKAERPKRKRMHM